uniref:Uncharacterized protein n=1 Tax=Arundo donax TaxID=35708 RepID=A0A0A9DXZ7_ARUDO
MEIMTRHLI